MSTPSTSLSDLYQPLSPEQVIDPYPIYQLARQQQPVFYSEQVMANAGMYIVTRYDDIHWILSQPDLFVSKDILRPLIPLYPESLAELEKGFPLTRIYLDTDGISHRRFRVPLTKIFGPQQVKQLEPMIRTITSKLVDTLEEDGTFQAEMVSQFCFPLPLQIILHIYGVPEADQEKTKQWSDDWLTFLFTHLPRERQLECVKSVEKFFYYMSDLVADRRKNPRENDPVTEMIMHVEPGMEPLSDAELVNTLSGLLLAGHETITGLLSSGLRHLLEPHERWETLTQHPELLPQTVEEILRYDAPTQCFTRTATRDVEVGGVSIPEGAMLLILYASASRDECKFQRADQFDPGIKREVKHLSFGHGKHSCLGAPLARAEGCITFELLTQRFPNLRLASGKSIEHRAMLQLRSLQKLFVEW